MLYYLPPTLLRTDTSLISFSSRQCISYTKSCQISLGTIFVCTKSPDFMEALATRKGKPLGNERGSFNPIRSFPLLWRTSDVNMAKWLLVKPQLTEVLKAVNPDLTQLDSIWQCCKRTGKLFYSQCLIIELHIGSRWACATTIHIVIVYTAALFWLTAPPDQLLFMISHSQLTVTVGVVTHKNSQANQRRRSPNKLSSAHNIPIIFIL